MLHCNAHCRSQFSRAVAGAAPGPHLSAAAAPCLHADSPAKLMLRMISDLLEGRMPDVRDVLVVRQAIRDSYDLYQPLDLGGEMRGAGVDVSGGGGGGSVGCLFSVGHGGRRGQGKVAA